MTWGLTQHDIAALKVGDKVGVSGGHYVASIEVVTRRTATQVIVPSGRFNKYGRLVGSDSWSSRHLVSVADAIEERNEHAKRRRRQALGRYAWDALTDEQVEQVARLLATFATKDAAAVSETAATPSTTEAQPK